MTQDLMKIHKAEFGAWNAMRDRCTNPLSKDYPNYGGRGITICDRWKKFRSFLEDMPPRPSLKYTLDRIDGDGHYEPGNCRWATRIEQNNNKKTVRKFLFRGYLVTIGEALRICNSSASHNVIYCRVVRGRKSLEEAINTPINSRRSGCAGLVKQSVVKPILALEG